MSQARQLGAFKELTSREARSEFLERYFICAKRPTERQGFLRTIAKAKQTVTAEVIKDAEIAIRHANRKSHYFARSVSSGDFDVMICQGLTSTLS